MRFSPVNVSPVVTEKTASSLLKRLTFISLSQFASDDLWMTCGSVPGGRRPGLPHPAVLRPPRLRLRALQERRAPRGGLSSQTVALLCSWFQLEAAAQILTFCIINSLVLCNNLIKNVLNRLQCKYYFFEKFKEKLPGFLYPVIVPGWKSELKNTLTHSVIWGFFIFFLHRVDASELLRYGQVRLIASLFQKIEDLE